MQKNISNKMIKEPIETKSSGTICRVCGYVNANFTGKCLVCQSNLK